jgi:hypothetical protein
VSTPLRTRFRMRQFRSKAIGDIALISILLFVFCLRIWNFGIVHVDDAAWALRTFQPEHDVAGDWARTHGRFYAFPYGAIMLHTLAWLGTTYGELLRVGSFAVFFALFVIFAAVYCGRRVALLSSCFFFAFFALRWEESCLTAGPLAPWVLASAAVSGTLLARGYAHGGRPALAIAAALCLFVSLFNNEAMTALYCVLFALVIAWNALESSPTRPSVRAALAEFIRPGRTRTLACACGAAVLAYAAIYVGWRLHYPSQYDGHVLASFDIARIATVAFNFATSNSILHDGFQPYRINFTDLLGASGVVQYTPSTFIRTLPWRPAAVMFGCIVGYHFYRGSAARPAMMMTKVRALAPELFGLVVGLAFASVSMLPPAATEKYQGWYFSGGAMSFSTAIFAYFGVSLSLAAVVSALLRLVRPRWRPLLFAVPTLFVGFTAAVSYRMNDEIAHDMRFESGRWLALAATIESTRAAQMNVSAVWAPRFKAGSWFGELKTAYWSEYAKARYQADIQFLEGLPPADMLSKTAYVDYVLSDDNTSYIAIVARLRPAERGDEVVADRIALHVGRPDAALLRNSRLSFLDQQGALQQIPVKNLTALGNDGKIWLLDNAHAVPSSIRIAQQTYVKRELHPCATTRGLRYVLPFGNKPDVTEWDCTLGSFALQSGWGPVEAQGVWSDGNEARFSIVVGGSGSAVSLLTFDMATVTSVGLAQGTQTVRAYINDRLMATWKFTAGSEPPYTAISIPAELRDPAGHFAIRFEIDRPITAQTLPGFANDSRELGVNLRSIKVDVAQ